MVLVRTSLGETREDARHERFEQVVGNNATNVQQAIAQVAARTQRSITAAGNLPIVSTDSTLNINNVADLAPVIPLASSRNGVPLTIKNLPGSHIQTLARSGADTFDGATSYILNPGASVTLVPYNDGVNTGYAIE